jgi:hypothetical protein
LLVPGWRLLSFGDWEPSAHTTVKTTGRLDGTATVKLFASRPGAVSVVAASLDATGTPVLSYPSHVFHFSERHHAEEREREYYGQRDGNPRRTGACAWWCGWSGGEHKGEREREWVGSLQDRCVFSACQVAVHVSYSAGCCLPQAAKGLQGVPFACGAKKQTQGGEVEVACCLPLACLVLRVHTLCLAPPVTTPTHSAALPPAGA